MASYDELRKQVESLRQVNTSLQREILDNNAHLSRLHENSAHLARYSNSPAPQTGSHQSGSNTSSPKVSRQQANAASQADRCQSNSSGSSPKVNRQHLGPTSVQSRQNDTAVNHMSRQQVDPTFSQRGFAPRHQHQQDTAANAISHLSRLQDNPNSQSFSIDGAAYQDTPTQGGDICQGYFSFNEDMEGEHMATFDDDLIDGQTTLDPVTPGNQKGHDQELQGQGHREGSHGTDVGLDHLMVENIKEILERLQHLSHERSNLVQQMESEDKNRKWYYDQIEVISRKIRSLPVTDGHPNKQPGLTRKHLEFEIERLKDTMLSSFGSNEQIGQRQDGRVQRIRHIDAEIISLRQHRQQMLQEAGHNDSRLRHQSSSDSAHSSHSDHDLDQVTMATQTDVGPESGQIKMTFGHNVPGAIYHGAWPMDDSIPRSQSAGNNGDLASVMSFTSTNTSSSHGSGTGVKGQPKTQQQQQMGPIPLQIPPQQLGTKVEMVYGLLSMLGTHDKDDMSKTLLAMSSSQDSCIAMRQSGCLPLLIQLLHGSDQDSGLLGNTRGSKAARARAAASLHNIVHSHPDDKRGRREARVLRLLEQIRAHCDQLRDSNSSDEEEDDKQSGEHPEVMDHHPGPAIATLMKLSFDEEHRHAICTLGGLHAIAELLQVDNDIHQDTNDQYNITMRRYACMALTNLTFGDGTNKALLCSMKTSMAALVAQLYSLNEELCQVSASVLRNLSWKADLASKKTLREVGAVTSLMKASMRVQKETTLKSILSALWNLSAHCSENKADICAVASALEFLISTLTYKSPSKTTAIIENGGGILRNVSSHIAVREDYREVLRQHGCLQILLKHLRSPSLTIVSNACGTLWNLSARSAEDQQALWEMGAIGMLRNLVHSKHKMISMGSSAALKNLLAARPAMKSIELNKHNSQNRPTLHVRKQRALESEIDQNLSETCENVESPRDSPVENKKQSVHFVYPVYQIPEGDPRRALLRGGPIIPRSQSGDNTLYGENKGQNGVARSGSQDSVGSTHSDISHNRSRNASGGGKAQRSHSTMGGSLDRHKEGNSMNQRFEGRSERNPLGTPNSRILQVMQEVAMHAGLDGQARDQNDSAVFKAPFPVTSMRSQHQQQAPPPSSSAASSHQQQLPPTMSQQQQQQHFQAHLYNTQHASAYHRFIMTNLPPHSNAGHFNMAANMAAVASHQNQNEDDDSDEKPLDYSMKYQEGGVPSQQQQQHDPRFSHSNIPHHPMMGNFVGNPNMPPHLRKNYNPNQGKHQYMQRQGQMNQIDNRIRYNSAYAETDLDDPEQPTDYSARYGVDYNTGQFNDETMNYNSRYDDSDPNCADCKLEEARRFHDRLDQAIDEDQIKTFCTEDTPYLSTATSLTDLSTAVKILEEAEEQCPAEDRDFNGDETQNFGSKYGENENNGQGHVQRSCDHGHGSRSDEGQKGQRYDGEKSSRSGSNITDIQTGTTVITNYHLKTDRQSQESVSLSNDEPTERSFHDNRNDDAPMDQTKEYYEEGTPVCFSRVSSLSSLHSSEAADRQEKRPQSNVLHGNLQSINESEDMNSSIVKMPPAQMAPHSYRQKDDQSDNGEKEHKTVTFDDKEQVQETPLMFSRCTSLGSLSSFDAQSVHSSVFSEYSRRASEVVSPSELPDSPSETMPPSPRRTKSPERNPSRKVNTELFPPMPPNNGPQQFSVNVNSNVQRVNPLQQFFGLNQMVKQMDYETGSSKSEAPVVYADEGTPPVFSDNLSELSCITSDNYSINDKTLVEGGGNMTPGAKSQGSGNNKSSNTTQEVGRQHNEALTEKNEQEIISSNTADQDQKVNQIVTKTGEEAKDVSKDTKSEEMDKKQLNGPKEEEKALSSNSDVSEGENDLLADFISSAMPASSKKARKSSSDNTSRRKSGSSKPDSGASSRSKTPAKSQPQSGSSSKSSSVNSSAKKSQKMPSNKTLNETSPDQKQSTNVKVTQGSSPGKQQRSHIPRPMQHRQVQQMAQLDCSMDSTTSYQSDNSPFNTSNTQTIITRPNQKSKPVIQPSPLVLEKARNLSNIETEDDGDEGCRTYATEDTPFSGSIPASPKSERRMIDPASLPDPTQDTVKSYATEDTPFSGSVPASPPPTHPCNYGNEEDVDADSVKCFNTEDTPFSGSTFGSPRLGRKQLVEKPAQKIQQGPQNLFQVNNPQNSLLQGSQNSFQVNAPQNSLNCPRGPVNQVQFAPQGNNIRPQGQKFMGQGQQVAGGLIRGQNVGQARFPMRHPQFNPQMLNNVDYDRDDFDDGGDECPKTFATEGTPQNYSRTGSCSDLSSLNANFEEKIKIDQSNPQPKITSSSTNNEPAADDSDSSLEENDDLLSEIIQSAMPAPKPGKSRRSIDRNPEGAENSVKSEKNGVNQIKGNNSSSVPAHFQPQRTSSLAQEGGMPSRVSQNSHYMSDLPAIGMDQMKSYAMEGTPSNMSNSTSFSDLTVDSFPPKSTGVIQQQNSSRGPIVSNQSNHSSLPPGYEHSSTFGTGNDSVFLHSDGGGDSMKVFKMEGTPQSFSCNESLSSLGIVDNDSNNEISMQVKALANKLTDNNRNQIQASNVSKNPSSTPSNQSGMKHNVGNNEMFAFNKERSDSKTSVTSNSSRHSGMELERQVIGQSSEDQSIHEDECREIMGESNRGLKSVGEEIKNYQVEDTPICFSRNSSLSSINEPESTNQKRENKPGRRSLPVNNKYASMDEKSGYKVEHTPICFSRNSSLSDLSVHSDEDDDPDEMALLEDCITSALPPRTRSSKSSSVGSSRHGGRGIVQKSASGDELERSGRHDSRYNNWLQQSQQSGEDVFRKPIVDAKGRPCRRSRSQDSEKHYKDMADQQIPQQFVQQPTNYRGSYDSLSRQGGIAMVARPQTNQESVAKQQQIISESKNLTHQVTQMTRSAEKGEDHGSDKNDSPASDYNFFMSCSGNTEISVEGISKQSFPSSMAPDTDDDILEGSISMLDSYRDEADGEHMISSRDNTLTENGLAPRSLNSTLTDNRNIHAGKQLQVDRRWNGVGMEASLTSEDEQALAENANIVMAEMRMNQMVLSGTSTVDEENFIENETLSLVSNDYMSDTASEASNTWSEGSSNRPKGSGQRPRILKPGDRGTAVPQKPTATEEKAVKGRRKPLYSSKSVSSSNSPQNLPSSAMALQQGKSQSHSFTNPQVGKVSPRTIPGSSSANTSSSSTGNNSRRSHTLRTMPQASSTPVKSSSPAQRLDRSAKSSPQPRSSSLDQRSQPRGNTSANRSSSSNRSGSVTRMSNNVSQNISGQSNKSSSKSSPKNKNETKENQCKPKGLSKQGTFIKETTNRNAPVISPNDKTKDIGSAYGVKMRSKKNSESSQNRNSSGSSKSNFSNNSNNSNSFSTTSSDSPPDSWSKALNSYQFTSEQEASGKKKGKKGFGSTGANVRRNLMNDAHMSKIPSPSRGGFNKSGSGGNVKKACKEGNISKSSSGQALGKSGLIKTGSSGSLKQTGSRPTTPVIMNNRKESTGSLSSGNEGKKGKKTVTSKISGLWKSEKSEKSKNKADKKVGSKLPVAKGKGKSKKADCTDQGVKTAQTPKQNVNRNTYILNESSVDGLSKSSTYDKLNATNDTSQVPNHDIMRMSGTSSRSGTGVNDSSKTKGVFDETELNKTCRDMSVLEVGVEYDLEEAWACNVEKSIEVMSRSIEDNKTRIDSFYDDFVDTSKMDLTNSPANRLSKSGSMSEIELEFGRIHSGTWTKKKSHNEFTALPNADETSKTLPLKKRSESLNFATHMAVSHSIDFDDEGQEVWIRRNGKFRASDTTSKKKKAFKGSSGFLNAVSKMFGGGSKKVADKQSKSFSVSEQDQKILNESLAKHAKKENQAKLNKSEIIKDGKMNKSELKMSKSDQKAELKQLKAEQKAENKQFKAESKLNKSELKAMKKEAKLNKSLKGKRSIDVEDCSSSTSSLKKSAEDLIDIDKSDDDDVFCVQDGNLGSTKTGSQSHKRSDSSSGEKHLTSPKSPETRRYQTGSDKLNQTGSQTCNSNTVPLLNSHHQYLNQSNSVSSSSSASFQSNQSFTDTQHQGNDIKSSSSNKSMQGSPNSHLTKTEMLLARRQAQLNSSHDRSDDGEDSDNVSAKKKPIVTTV